MSIPLLVVLVFMSLLGTVRSIGVVDSKDLHERITQGLIDIKKQHPASTAKIYTMLDQVDKLFSHTKDVEHENNVLKQELQNHHNDKDTLKTENESFKQRLSKAKKSLVAAKSVFDKTTKKLEEEKSRTQYLEDQQKLLLARIDQLESGSKKEANRDDEKEHLEQTPSQEQLLARHYAKRNDHYNFRRTSSSEPSSP